MKTLTQLRTAIASKQAEYRSVSSLNNGVMRGATPTESLQSEIITDIQEYSSRSKRDQYIGGRIVKV